MDRDSITRTGARAPGVERVGPLARRCLTRASSLTPSREYTVKANSFVGISERLSLRESCIREKCTCSLSGGRRPARKRASSDPTPMNPSNKDGTSLAEREEGRLLIKENTFPSRTYPTQSGSARVPRGGEL